MSTSKFLHSFPDAPYIKEIPRVFNMKDWEIKHHLDVLYVKVEPYASDNPNYSPERATALIASIEAKINRAQAHLTMLRAQLLGGYVSRAVIDAVNADREREPS